MLVVAQHVQVAVVGVDAEPAQPGREPAIDDRPHGEPTLAPRAAKALAPWAAALTDWSRVKVESRAAATRTTTPEMELRDGDRVRHGQFGEGLVVSTKKTAADTEVTVVFESVGLKRLLLSFARLEKINK